MQRLGSGQNGLIGISLVGRHQQQLWLIVILTISELIFIIYLPLLYSLLLIRLEGGEEEEVGPGGGRKGTGRWEGREREGHRGWEKEEKRRDGRKTGWEKAKGVVGGKEAWREDLIQYERHWNGGTEET